MNNDMYNVMAPCKGCQDRKLACHDRCDKYKIYKEEINRIRIKDINERQVNYSVCHSRGNVRIRKKK